MPIKLKKILNEWIGHDDPIYRAGTQIIRHWLLFLKFFAGAGLAVCLYFFFFQPPYEATWQISDKQDQLGPGLKPIILKQVIQEVIQKLNLRVTFSQTHFFADQGMTTEESPVKLRLIQYDPLQSSKFVLTSREKQSYDLYLGGRHYLYRYGGVVVINQCKFVVDRSDAGWPNGRLKVEIGNLFDITHRINDLLTVSQDDHNTNLVFKISGSHPSEVYAIASAIRKVYLETKLKLEMGIDPGFDKELIDAGSNLGSLSKALSDPSANSVLTREKQATALKVYFSMLQKKEEFARRLAAVQRVAVVMDIEVVRVPYGWRIVLLTVIAGMLGATSYLVIYKYL